MCRGFLLLILLRATDIIMFGQRVVIKKQWLFVKPFCKDVFDHGIIYPWTACYPSACLFQSLFGILFFKHQHAIAGFIILLHINTVFKHVFCSLPGVFTYSAGLRQQALFCPPLYLVHMQVVGRHVFSNSSISFAGAFADMQGYAGMFIINFNALAII